MTYSDIGVSEGRVYKSDSLVLGKKIVNFQPALFLLSTTRGQHAMEIRTTHIQMFLTLCTCFFLHNMYMILFFDFFETFLFSEKVKQKLNYIWWEKNHANRVKLMHIWVFFGYKFMVWASIKH